MVATNKSKVVNGKKEGVWKNCLNEKFESCAPEEAKYYEYVLVNNGGGWASSSFGETFSEYYHRTLVAKRWEVENPVTSDSIQPLNGTYTGYARKNIKLITAVYKDGMLKYATSYFRNGSVKHTEDYTKPINGEPFTGYRIFYKKSGKPSMKCEFGYTTDENGWGYWDCLKTWQIFFGREITY